MGFIEFCCRSGGNNLNAGTRKGSSTQPGVTADFTYDGSLSGDTFTVSSGDPSADGVAAYDYGHVSDDSQPGRIARVTSTTSTTIVLDANVTVTYNSGTYTKARIGGAWKGFNGSSAFPLGSTASRNVGYLSAAANTLPLRVNFKNDQTYSITTGITGFGIGGTTFQGYSSAYGDGGRATIDGGGNSIVLLTGGSANKHEHFIYTNNGTSNTIGVAGGGADFIGCVIHGIGGSGYYGGTGRLLFSEVYDCNKSNTAKNSGAVRNGTIIGCVVHHSQTGSNCHGATIDSGSSMMLINSVFAHNAGCGLYTEGTGRSFILGCDFFNNSSHGIDHQGVTSSSYSSIIANSNIFKNGAYGVRGTEWGNGNIVLLNNGFGTGTQANTSGNTYGNNVINTDPLLYPSGEHPWRDPDNGDFSIVHPLAKGSGFGEFLQTYPGYSGTTGHPDIGAAPHQQAAIAAMLVNAGLVR